MYQSMILKHRFWYHGYDDGDTYYDKHNRGPFHKSSYERFLLYEFVEPVLNYRSNEFVALTNLCETGPRCINYVVSIHDLKSHLAFCHYFSRQLSPLIP